jgi:hypothetical protein
VSLTLAQTRERFAQALVKDLPGLQLSVARAWSAAEVGTARNSLGTGGATGPTYATPELGAQAAANLIKTSGQYAGIRASLKSTNPNTQATAIAQSPWHLGATGLKTAGGTDPYYARIFKMFGLTVPGATVTSGKPGGSSDAAGAPSQPGAAPNLTATAPAANDYGAKFLHLLSTLGISTDPSHVITPTEATKIAANFGSVYGGGAHPIAGSFAGHTVGQQTNIQQNSGKAIADSPAATVEAIGNIPNLLGIAIGHVFLIIGGVLCVLVGIWIVVRQDRPATDPALLKMLQGGKASGAAAVA